MVDDGDVDTPSGLMLGLDTLDATMHGSWVTDLPVAVTEQASINRLL